MFKSFISLVVVFVMVVSFVSYVQESIFEVVEGLILYQGFLISYVDSLDGCVLIEFVLQDDGLFGCMIYIVCFILGFGFNLVGLDCGLGLSFEILWFIWVNDQVFVEFENIGYVVLGVGLEEVDVMC